MSRRNRNAANVYAPENEGLEQTIADAETPPNPFDGCGVSVEDRKTVAGMMKAAGLNWETKKHQLRDDTDEVPAFALRRSDTGAFLDTVGKAYVPIHNREAFEFFGEFVEKGDAKMSLAGSLGGGRYVWGLADLGTSFKLNGDDEVKGYLFIAVPHVQGKKLVIKYTNYRIRCNNIVASVLRGPGAKSSAGIQLPEFRHAHRTAFTGAVADRAREVLQIAREQHEAFGEQAAHLQKKRMGDEAAREVLRPIFAPKLTDEQFAEGKSTPRLDEIMSLLHDAPGAVPGTAWGVLNAVTYYTTHCAGRTQDRRLQQTWMGKTGNQVTETVAALLDA